MKNQSYGKLAESSVRTFLCLEVAEPIKARIGELQSRLQSVSPDVSWVNSANIHLTLKFLGGTSQDRLVKVIEGARRAAAITGQFHLEVRGAGYFPSARSPRVLWVGLAQTPRPLHLLFEAVEDQMAQVGFAREKRPFSPHLTIGRVRSNRNIHQLIQLMEEIGFPGGDFEVTELIVMRSDLKPTGAIYTPLSGVVLGTQM